MIGGRELKGCPPRLKVAAVNGIHAMCACIMDVKVNHNIRSVHVVRNCGLSTPLHYGKHSINCLLLQG